MTAKLSLRLNKDLGGASATDGAVTHLYGLDEAGKRDPSRDLLNLVIPAGYGAGHLTVDVGAGEYLVEAVLPSGDVATDQVQAVDGREVPVELVAPHSPHEWLSWQQYLGNVPARPDEGIAKPKARSSSKRPPGQAATRREQLDQYIATALEAASSAVRSSPQRSARSARSAGSVRSAGGTVGLRGVVAKAMRARGSDLDRMLLDDGRDYCLKRCSSRRVIADIEAARPRVPRSPPWPVVWYIDEPELPFSGVVPHGAKAWDALAQPSVRKRPIAALSIGPAKRSAHLVRDEARQIFAFGADGPIRDDQRDPGRSGELPRRYLIASQSRGPVELACLPVPWDSGGLGRVPIEVLVRRHPLVGESMIAMSPRDPVIGSALGYMGTGALANARIIFDRALDLLYGKQINPLGAAAGGYVLLATDQGEQDENWHQWIENLARWFPWLPDGMILYGRLRMKRRRGEADVEEAKGAFFEAFDRGIPFYSLGLQWLVDGLGLLATRDAEAQKRLAQVQEVAWLANLQQPFTTIRLRDR